MSSAAGVQKITLPSGLRLLLIPSPGLTTTALILVAAGSEYETRTTNGLSHFLEHMVFKGTARRPEPGQTAEALDALGAEYNAFTAPEFTGYWAKAESHRTPELLELVSDLYLRPLFNPAEIEKERGVVIEELNMYADTPTRKIHDVFMSAMYGDQPAGWDVGGTKEVIRRLGREEFLAYRGARYVPAGTVVAVAGDFDPERISQLVRREFGSLAAAASPGKPSTRPPAAGPRVQVRVKSSDQSHFILGVPTFPLADPRRYAAELLSHVLAGGMSSRLFRRIREEMGAAYYVHGEHSPSADHGYMGFWVGANNGRLAEVIRAVLEECARLTRELVGPAELRKSQDHLAGTFLLGLETSDSLAEFYAEQELMEGRGLSPEEVAGRLRGVAAADLRDLARTIFRDEGLVLAVIGPAEEVKLQSLLHFPV